MESAHNPEILDALDRKIRVLEAEESQLAKRAGVDTGAAANGTGAKEGGAAGDAGSAPRSAVAFMNKITGGRNGARDKVAAGCLEDVQKALAVLREQRASLGGEVAKEREALGALTKLRWVAGRADTSWLGDWVTRLLDRWGAI